MWASGSRRWRASTRPDRSPTVGWSGRRRSTSPISLSARERYDRVAAAVGVEPRDPFLDLRVIAFCVRLPDGRRLQNGWPKAILRRAMAGRLPDAVRWRRGKEHLGWAFTHGADGAIADDMRCDVEANLAATSRYVDMNAARSACRSLSRKG